MIIVILIHCVLTLIETHLHLRFKDKTESNVVTDPSKAGVYSVWILFLMMLNYPSGTLGPFLGNSRYILTAINISVTLLLWLCNRAYFRRKLVYDEEGFDFTDALGRKTRFLYIDAIGVTECSDQRAVTVYMRDRAIRLNGGYQAVLDFAAQVKRGYKKVSGHTLKAVQIRGKRGNFIKKRFFVLSVLAFVGYTLFMVILGLHLRLTPLSYSELEYDTVTAYTLELDRGQIRITDIDTKTEYESFNYSDVDEALEKVEVMEKSEALTVGYLEYLRRSGRGVSRIDYHIFSVSDENGNELLLLSDSDNSRIAVNRMFMMIFTVPTAIYLIFLIIYSAWYGAKKQSLIKYFCTS